MHLLLVCQYYFVLFYYFKCYNIFGEVMYLIEKTINKLYQDGFTNFLNPKDLKDVTNHLKKNTYCIYKPYPFSEKNILYLDETPKVVLLEIKVGDTIRHQDILGSLYHLGIDDSLFGDIVITNNHYYFYILEIMKPFFEMEFTKIKNLNIKLIERDINLLDDYEPNYDEIQVITSSLRIDSVIAKVIHTNRDEIKDLIKDKKIIYNYDILKDNNKILKEDDVFSIRKIGKFKFDEIIGHTKKDNYVLRILKYKAE